MDLEKYLQRRHDMAIQAERPLSRPRGLCLRCRQAIVGCYCHLVRPFDAKMKFVILIHPIEARRRIATGRMAHLILDNSELIQGEDFSQDRRVGEILADSHYLPVVLYPGSDALDLGRMTPDEQRARFPAGRELVIFVIDGTWATAKKTIRGEGLSRLPKICFSPRSPSRFRVRKQPAEGYYSTIEAIHQTIELLAESRGFALETEQHANLLSAFNWMVERQILFSPTEHVHPRDRHS